MWQISNVNKPERKFDIWSLLFPEWIFSNYPGRKGFDLLELGQSNKAQQPLQTQAQWIPI